MTSHFVDLKDEVTEHEAVTLMMHHLKLAVTYFEVGPERPLPYQLSASLAFNKHLAIEAVGAFILALHKAYEDEGM